MYKGGENKREENHKTNDTSSKRREKELSWMSSSCGIAGKPP
jgi:hypothetical protein